MKRVSLVLALAVVATACASGASEPSTTAVAEGTAATQPTAAPPTSSTTLDAPAAAQEPPLGGPEASDFTIVLASGDSYTLSRAVTPVYIIFWAES